MNPVTKRAPEFNGILECTSIHRMINAEPLLITVDTVIRLVMASRSAVVVALVAIIVLDAVVDFVVRMQNHIITSVFAAYFYEPWLVHV